MNAKTDVSRQWAQTVAELRELPDAGRSLGNLLAQFPASKVSMTRDEPPKLRLPLQNAAQGNRLKQALSNVEARRALLATLQSAFGFTPRIQLASAAPDIERDRTSRARIRVASPLLDLALGLGGVIHQVSPPLTEQAADGIGDQTNQADRHQKDHHRNPDPDRSIKDQPPAVPVIPGAEAAHHQGNRP